MHGVLLFNSFFASFINFIAFIALDNSPLRRYFSYTSCVVPSIDIIILSSPEATIFFAVNLSISCPLVDVMA